MAKLKQRDKANGKSSKRSGDKGRAMWRRLVLPVALACLLVAFFWAGGMAGFANSMAQNAIVTKRLDSAEWWLKVSRSISSDSYSDFLQARLDRHRGNLEEMSSHLKAAYKKGFDPMRLDQEQTLASASIGRLDTEVEDRLNRWLVEPNAEFGEILDAYTNGLMVVSRFEDALKILRLWEESLPGEATANYRIARIQEHLSQPAEAEAEYKKAIAKEPSNYRSVYNLGRILLDQRRSDEALELFKKCNHGPSALAAKAGMARCYKTQGENEIARTLLQDVLKSSYEEQLKSFRAVDEIPARFVAASELGCLETELGDFSEARKYLESALELFPLDSIARYSYAVALRGLGLQKEAEENFAITRAARASLDQVSVLQEKLRIDPQDTNSRIRIGKIILEHESERTGLFWLQSVFSYDAANPEAHEAIATYFENKRDRTPDDEKRIAYHRSFIEKKLGSKTK